MLVQGELGKGEKRGRAAPAVAARHQIGFAVLSNHISREK